MILGWIQRLFLTIGAMLTLFGAMPAAAQRPAAGDELRVCVLKDDGRGDAARLIRDPARFDCTAKQHSLGAGDFWVISQDIGRASTPATPLNARIASLWQQGLTLHILYADGTMRSFATDRRGIAPLIQLGAIAEQTIPAHAAPVVRVMWHVTGSANMRGVLLGARLSTEKESDRANLSMAALYAAFAGLCVALILYNLALWGALRHRFQLYYCVMVALLLVYTFSSSGALAWALPDFTNNERLRINYLLLGATGAAAVLFARSFFEDRVFAGWVGRFARIICIMMFGSGVLFFLTAPWNVQITDALFTATFVGLVGVVAATLLRAWRTGSSYLWLFALGWGAPIVAAAARTLSNLHILPWSFWIDNSTILSMMIETLTSALVIAFRIRQLRDERDEAVENEVLARRLADTDPLTGLLNRRAFLAQAIGREGEQTLFVADLDHFKRVNETLGHDGGDDVLRVFARLLRSVTPAGGLVARLGGEEFAILTDTGDAPEADLVLAKLRAARMPFDLAVTASIGTCRGPMASEAEWKALYRGADAALFDAKSAGRDRARDALRRAA